MTTPQRNDRTLRLREIARELENVDWPDEEPTIPNLTFNVTMPEQRASVSDAKPATESKPPTFTKDVPGAVRALIAVLSLVPPMARAWLLGLLIIAALVSKYLQIW